MVRTFFQRGWWVACVLRFDVGSACSLKTWIWQGLCVPFLIIWHMNKQLTYDLKAFFRISPFGIFCVFSIQTFIICCVQYFAEGILFKLKCRAYLTSAWFVDWISFCMQPIVLLTAPVAACTKWKCNVYFQLKFLPMWECNWNFAWINSVNSMRCIS